MTPAASWSPDDYYAARDGARAAFDKTDQQLSILSDSPALAMLGAGLGDDPLTPPVHAARADARVETASGTGIIAEPDRLTSGAEPRCDTGLTANQPVTAAPATPLRGRVGANTTTTEASANQSTERARLQEGA